MKHFPASPSLTAARHPGFPSPNSPGKREEAVVSGGVLRTPDVGPPLPGLAVQSWSAGDASQATAIAQCWQKPLHGVLSARKHFRFVIHLRRAPEDRALPFHVAVSGQPQDEAAVSGDESVPRRFPRVGPFREPVRTVPARNPAHVADAFAVADGSRHPRSGGEPAVPTAAGHA
ncbi:hypothetical protein MTO96_006435 [Rhipicephalus appendiculatus]